MSNNPLSSIFIKDSNGKLTGELDQINNVKNFFIFLKDDKIKNEDKMKVLDEFKNKIKENRYICEFFSSYENKSIYIYLFNLYLHKNSSDKLKNSILSLIEELCLNIQTGKEIYEYMFQKLAKIYRGEIPANSNKIYKILKLLDSILSEKENMLKPKNYFACSGNCKFYISMNEIIQEVGYSFTINVNFKISIYQEVKSPNKNRLSNLIKFYFSNNTELSIDLKYPYSLIIENIRKEPIKILSNLEWNNLNITLTNFNNKLNLYINVNGENNPSPYKLNNLPINYDHTIEFIELFNNFYGEVGSVYMFSQKDSGPPGVNSTAYLSELKKYQEGLWKKKIIEDFFLLIQKINAIDVMSKSIYFKSTKIGSEESKKKTLYDNLIFVFTPINFSKENPQLVEDVLGKYKMEFNGNIRNHQFQNYQKKLLYVSGLNNFLPIAEMFLIFPEILNEQNLELYLKIISNILNYRKHNLKNIKSYKFFNILSMFIEKYPQKIFNEKIFEAFYDLAKVLFTNNFEAICSNYFKHILLNEKILSKFSINLQIEFWNKLYLFCQSDVTQIQIFLNINRLCLILRFYDRNKYTEICCEEHLNMIKEEYVGSKKIMNPTMNQKLSYLKNIMNLIIDSQEPKNAVSLFKLLTLDLSPCLIKFILNIFINVFESNINEDWKKKFVEQLLQCKYEVIVTNTFLHSLPDIRIELLKFVYQVHIILVSTENTSKFKIFEKMLKTCILPDKMFYIKNIPSNNNYSKVNNMKNNSSIKKQELKKEEEKKPQQKKVESKKEEPKKPEPKKIEPKNQEIKKIEPKKEDHIRSPSNIQGGAGKQNFLSLLSKFDKSKNTSNNNDLNKSVQLIKPKDNQFKSNNSSTISSSNSNQSETQKKSFLQVREEILKKSIKKEEENYKEKKETQNTISSTNSSIANRPYSNTIYKPGLLNNASIFEKKSNNNNILQQKQPSVISTNLSKNSNNENINNNNNNYLEKYDEKNLIIKEEEIKNYIEKLYSVFMLWSLSVNVDMPFVEISLENSNIKIVDPIEIIFLLNNRLQNKDLILNFFKSISQLINKPENCYEIFFNKKVYASFLDTALENYKKTGKYEKECFDLCKNILVILFINSCLFCEKNPNLNPGNEIETLFIWGNKIQQEDSSKEKKDKLFDFISDLFFEFLLQFKIKFEVKLKIDSKDKNFSINGNYSFKNYLMLVTEIFIFLFRYKLDPDIHEKGLGFLGRDKIISDLFSNSMRISEPMTNDISKDWKDLQLIYDIFNRYKYLWVKSNLFKNINVDKYKNKKSEKYDLIIDKIILDKKKLYRNELSVLCFRDNKGGFEYIIPLIQIISLTIMCILNKLKNTKNEKDFLIWLKELKGFIRFIIIASCNFSKSSKNDFEIIQTYCYETIALGLIFMNNLISSNSICKEKIIKSLISLLILFFKLIKYQNNYEEKHNNILSKLKQGKKDLSNTSVIKIYNDHLKDSVISTPGIISRLETLLPNDINKRLSIINELKIFFESIYLRKKLLDSDYFNLNPYKNLVDFRYSLIPFLQETYDESYKKTILTLLPQYEIELAKYSNNSLEKNIKNRNKYKVIKKNSFSWRGYWSCRENFFTDNSKFKYKLINHYTRNFMKPILVPILDISYYLPEFSGFDSKTLFKKENNPNIKNNFIVSLDIEKILKTYDKNILENTKEKGKNENKENYLAKIYKRSNIVLYEKYLKISNNLEFGKEEEFSYIESEKTNKKDSNKEEEKKERKYFLSCLVKTSHHIKGVCFIDDNNLNFKVFLNQKTGSEMSGVEVGFTDKDDDYDQERKTCFGSYFVCHPKDKDLYKISIKYNEIKWIFRRRYYYTNSAFEIFTTTNKTYYFNFKYENDREIVLNEILKKIGDSTPIIDDLKENISSKESIIGYENGIIQKKKKDKIKLSKKLKKWKNWEITNFEILMWLNIFGNRSYNDISQYPIFPWILSNYEDPLQVEQKIQNNKNEDNQDYSNADSSANNNLNDKKEKFIIDFKYRNMNLPMGMLELNDEGMKRKELFIETYQTLKEEPDENMKPYVFGSNYSNPVYVCNYLMRLFPFTHISIELQGKKFDDPNRLFFSVKNSFFNSTSQKTDVRELIPEFFYLPEMFININKLNMGKLESGEEVNNVKTPCHDNPYDFIMTMKSVLESNKLSYTIQNWIDLIFGYKSRGKEAEKAYNIYTEASYQENIDINKVPNKESYLRMVEFGLIPTQIISKECHKREKKESIRKGKEITDSKCDLKYYLCKLHNENEIKANSKLIALKMGIFSSEKITLFLNNNIVVEKKIVFSTFEKNYYYEQPNITTLYAYNNKMSDFYNPNKFNGKVIQFCQKGKILILGGFYDGKVEMVPLDTKVSPVQIIPFIDKLPILSISIDKNEEFAFFGNSLGNIRILKLEKDISKSKLCQTITDHMSSISYIDCNSELNLWASASIDGYINIYTLPLSKLIRTIKIPTEKCDYVFLSSSPLPSIIAITEENNISEIFVYSINGKFLLRQKEQDLISCPLIISDLNANNYLAYIVNDSIIIRSIPTLIRQGNIDLPNIYAIYPSEDMKYLYAINKSGSEIYIIKDEN